MQREEDASRRYGPDRLSRRRPISVTVLALLLALLAGIAIIRREEAPPRHDSEPAAHPDKPPRANLLSRLAAGRKPLLAIRTAAVAIALCAACMLLLALAAVAGPSGALLAQTAPTATLAPTPVSMVAGAQTIETPEPAALGPVQSRRTSILPTMIGLIAREANTAEHALDAARSNATTVTLHHFDSPLPAEPSQPEAAATAPDSSPYFLDAYLYNGPTLVEEGRFGKALQLDGVDDYAELTCASSLPADDALRQLEMRDALTVQAWVNPSPDRPRRYVIMSNENAASYALSLVSTKPGDARLMFTVYATNDPQLSPDASTAPAQGIPSSDWYWALSSVSVPSGCWTHVAASFERGASDGRYLKVFVNGVDVTDPGYSRQPPGNDYFIMPGRATSASDMTRFVWPIKDRITNPFGPSHPLGIDIAAKPLQPVVATASGRVHWAGDDPNCRYGLYVIIDHGGGITSLYAHLSSLGVSAGEEVEQGAIIGFAGATGYAFGTHLHFEIRQAGRPLNPAALLPSLAGNSYASNPSTAAAQDPNAPADDPTPSQGFVVGARPGWWDGASWRGVGSLFKGTIDEVKVSRVALQEFDLTQQPTLDDVPKALPTAVPAPPPAPPAPQEPQQTTDKLETP